MLVVAGVYLISAVNPTSDVLAATPACLCDAVSSSFDQLSLWRKPIDFQIVCYSLLVSQRVKPQNDSML